MLFGAANLLALSPQGITAAELARFERYVSAARSQLGDEPWEKLWQEGQAMTLEQAVGYALHKVPPSAAWEEGARP